MLKEKKIKAKGHEMSDNSDDDRFLELDKDSKEQILQGSKKESTNKATESHMKLFRSYLRKKKNSAIIEEICDSDLPDIICDFFYSARSKEKQTYAVQSLKCIRASLNRYFKTVRGINIITDSRFIRCNEVFDGCKAKAKKEGKGVRKRTEKITDDDMNKIGQYFSQNYQYEKELDPRKLQQCVMFYIMFFFCRRGQENLHDMMINTYNITKDDKGRKYLYQEIDEIDKNHTADDSNPTNQGRMYENKGNNKIFFDSHPS